MDDGQIKAAAVFCQDLVRSDLVRSGFAGLDFVEFLPYHRLGADTYRKLRREFLMGAIMPPNAESIEKAKHIFNAAAPDVRLM